MGQRRYRPIRMAEHTTLGEMWAEVAADLDRRDRRLPDPLPEVFVARLIVTLLEHADEIRPVLWRILRRSGR